MAAVMIHQAAVCFNNTDLHRNNFTLLERGSQEMFYCTGNSFIFACFIRLFADE